MKLVASALCLASALVCSRFALADEGTTFAIRQFQISGNQLLDTDTLQSLVAPYTGDARSSGDIRNAQKAIENAYRAAGYGTVRAVTPEQELTAGLIRIDVVEARVRKISVVGNSSFSEANIRASLPALQEGQLPNLRQISENVQLANENPAKRAEVLLNSLDDAGALEARVLVNDENPLRLSLSLDNTGNHDTGRHRLGVALQYANLFDRDHVATLAYTTSPEETEKVDIYSLSYRLPLYALGDSVDFIYGHSSVDSGSTQTVAGPLNFSGSGEVFGLRYNHYFARKGEFSSRLTLGLDHRAYDNSCNINGASCGSADEDVTVRPVSLTWIGQWLGSGKRSDVYAAVAKNISGGSNGRDDDFDAVRNGAESNYLVLRYGANLMRDIGRGWQLRAALTGQYAPQPLVPGEQVGLAGNAAVRGFGERIVSVDTGVVGNLELYTPNLTGSLGASGQYAVRGLAFVDAADGRNRDVISDTQLRHATLASAGVGMRAELGNRASLRLDLAHVLHTHDDGGESTGDWRGHFALNVLF